MSGDCAVLHLLSVLAGARCRHERIVVHIVGLLKLNECRDGLRSNIAAVKADLAVVAVADWELLGHQALAVDELSSTMHCGVADWVSLAHSKALAVVHLSSTVLCWVAHGVGSTKDLAERSCLSLSANTGDEVLFCVSAWCADWSFVSLDKCSSLVVSEVLLGHDAQAIGIVLHTVFLLITDGGSSGGERVKADRIWHHALTLDEIFVVVLSFNAVWDFLELEESRVSHDALAIDVVLLRMDIWVTVFRLLDERGIPNDAFAINVVLLGVGIRVAFRVLLSQGAGGSAGHAVAFCGCADWQRHFVSAIVSVKSVLAIADWQSNL